MIRQLQSVQMVRWATTKKSVGFSLCFPRRLRLKKSSSIIFPSSISTGGDLIYPRSYRVYVLWMSGRKCRGNSGRSFVHISRKSFGVGVKVFGFTTEVMLHTSLVDTT